MDKPVVQIKDAFLVEDRLSGYPVDYPESHRYRPGEILNNRLVVTSAIVKRNGDVVETQRTLYQVLNWVDSSNLNASP